MADETRPDKGIHKLLSPADCRCDRDHGCPICEGGLALCTVCGGAEASLPHECPGYRMTADQQDAVQAGTLDFRDDHWVGASVATLIASDKMEPGEARERGFTIDTTCYPWLGYKGPRFRPTETVDCYTDDEAALLVAIEAIWHGQKIVASNGGGAYKRHVESAIYEAAKLLPLKWRQGSAA